MYTRLLLVLTAILVTVLSPTASAVQLTITVDSKFLSGLGECGRAPGGCTDLVNIPPGGDSNGPFDQVTLIVTNFFVDTAVPGSLSFNQPYQFVLGPTGAGSVGFEDAFQLDRTVTVSDGGAIHSFGTLVQSGNLLVGMFEDTLTIHDSSPLVFSLPDGQLTITMNGVSVATDADLAGEILGQAVFVPLPPALVLFGTGVLALMRRRRLPA